MKFKSVLIISESFHIRKNPTVVTILSILDKKIAGLFLVMAKNRYKTFIEKPGRRTNLNQVRSLELKFAPNISDRNFGFMYPNNDPAATERPSIKANI